MLFAVIPIALDINVHFDIKECGDADLYCTPPLVHMHLLGRSRITFICQTFIRLFLPRWMRGSTQLAMLQQHNLLSRATRYRQKSPSLQYFRVALCDEEPDHEQRVSLQPWRCKSEAKGDGGSDHICLSGS